MGCIEVSRMCAPPPEQPQRAERRMLAESQLAGWPGWHWHWHWHWNGHWYWHYLGWHGPPLLLPPDGGAYGTGGWAMAGAGWTGCRYLRYLGESSPSPQADPRSSLQRGKPPRGAHPSRRGRVVGGPVGGDASDMPPNHVLALLQHTMGSISCESVRGSRRKQVDRDGVWALAMHRAPEFTGVRGCILAAV